MPHFIRAFSSRIILVLIAAASLPLAARADTLQSLEEAAGQYLSSIQDQYGSTDDPAASAADVAQGTIALGRGDMDAAVKAFEQAIAAGDKSAATWGLLANAQLRRSDFTNAGAAAYSAYGAAESPADKATALVKLGGILEKAEEPTTALQAYQESLKLAFDQAIKDRADNLAESLRFRVIAKSTATTGDTPEACLEFYGTLSPASDVHYEDYVKVTPAPAELSFTVSDTKLCMQGVEFGARYHVTVLAGLPNADGDKLSKQENIDVAIGDADASLGFKSATYVLPKIGSMGVPLYSVNVSKAALRLLRINDRNIVDAIQKGSFLRAVDNYDADAIAQNSGEEVWKGSVSVVPERNKRVTTLVPVTEMVPQLLPGVYLLVAQRTDGGEDQYGAKATQWLIVTDLGLSTMDGADGLNVFVRSLDSGRALDRVTVKLYARNNDELGSVVTDRHGQATFAPGLMRGTEGRTATAVMVFRRDGDFAFLDLTRPAFDLSDRGVGGRLAPDTADVFLYSDRGVYRPGETVHLGALLRDTSGSALAGMPLTLRLVRPDEVEANRFALKDAGAGGYGVDVPISASARTGSWTVEAYLDPKGAAIGSMTFLVEDVVPAHIESKLTTDAKSITPGQPTNVDLQSKYLYGAPGAGLLVKASIVIEQDSAPYADLFPGYAFGLADEPVEAQTENFDDTSTDDKGVAQFDMTPTEIVDTPQPLKATLRTEVYEFGGRPVIKTLTLPIRNHALSIGLKPQFTGGAVDNGSDAGFDVVAVNGAGAAIAENLRYRLIPEDWDYQWFFKDGNWDYRVVTRDKPAAASGLLQIAADKAGHLALKVDYGYYRLEVFDPTTGAASSNRFYAGWGSAPGTGDTPDKLQVVADKPLYNAGDTAKILIKPPFAGEVLITIATDHVIEAWTVDATPDGRSIDIPVDAAWGPGAYVLASAFRPGSEGEHGPGRAIGVAWLGLDPAARSLTVSFDLPADVRPSQGVDVPVKVEGLTAGQPAFVTVAAVDEGILQLTEFATPAPQTYYFGKRSLGVYLRDLYGQLIDGRDGKRGEIREGGDANALGQRGAPPEIKLVALYSGILKLDDQGHAKVHLDIPDYNGRLRLMAVAWDASKVGAGDAGLVVRDPVVATVAMPRFLAPGDRSQMTISLQNLTGPAGYYKVSLSIDGAAALGDGAETMQRLDSGGTAVIKASLLGHDVGEANIRVQVAGPEGFKLEHRLKLYVRAAQFPLLDRVVKRLQPGESLTLGDAALARFLPSTGELYASVSSLPNLDVPALLRQLDRYPYGCIEQTTSRALPLLYVSDVEKLWGAKSEAGDAGIKGRIQQAIGHVLEMQRYDGGFALWDASGEVEPWLSAYAMDFLTRAKAKGFEVSDIAYANGLRWLTDNARRNDEGERNTAAFSARAYALYVLAEAGGEELSALRYLADNELDKLPSALAQAQIGAALALRGDQSRASEAFKKALASLKREAGQPDWYDDYGGAMRDGAAIVTLATEAKVQGVDTLSILERVAGLQASAAYLSTQEQSWLVLAANAMSAKAAPLNLTVDGKPAAQSGNTFYLRPDAATLQKGTVLKNAGSGLVYASATVIGVPAQDLPAGSNGLAIGRRFFTPDGKPADLTKVKQSDVLIVVLKGKRRDADSHQALVVDLLPAGFEIENTRLSGAAKTDQFAWLGDLSTPSYAEFRDDRYVAAVNLDEDHDSFALAYLVRAVTPGTYRLPGSSIEDMYRPNLRARAAMGNVTVMPYSGQSQ
jgi:alpha-2-macroglobulin